MSENNPHAFPSETSATTFRSGMTLRDYFAAKAMPIAWDMAKEWFEIDEPEKMISRIAYDIADKMLEARNATQ